MTEAACIKAAIVSGIIGVIGLLHGAFSLYLTYKLAMATLQKQNQGHKDES